MSKAYYPRYTKNRRKINIKIAQLCKNVRTENSGSHARISSSFFLLFLVLNTGAVSIVVVVVGTLVCY